jgi:hypothetical protein
MSLRYRQENPEPIRCPAGPWLVLLLCAGLYAALEHLEPFRSTPVRVRLLMIARTMIVVLIVVKYLRRDPVQGRYRGTSH